jgi:hypothetical protein
MPGSPVPVVHQSGGMPRRAIPGLGLTREPAHNRQAHGGHGQAISRPAIRAGLNGVSRPEVRAGDQPAERERRRPR